MLAHFDLSDSLALFPDHPMTAVFRDLWLDCERNALARLLQVEAVAGFAQAGRTGQLETGTLASLWSLARPLLAEVQIIELDDDLMNQGARCAFSHGLRGYDAAHCAAAKRLTCPPPGDKALVAATLDKSLRATWTAPGITVVPNPRSC